MMLRNYNYLLFNWMFYNLFLGVINKHLNLFWLARFTKCFKTGMLNRVLGNTINIRVVHANID